jgi:hypothetical protein
VHDGLLDPKLTSVTDEANFNLSGYVNSNAQSIFINLATAEERVCYFMQDGETLHTAKETIGALRGVLGEFNG